MSTDKTVYIVVSEYDEQLAKRQPWYTVRFFREELTERGYEVNIVCTLADIPVAFRGKVIKLLSLRDFFTGIYWADRTYHLIYLCTLPIYRAREILRCGPATILRNFADLWRLLVVSLLPRFWIRFVLSRSARIVFLSDVRFQYFGSLPNASFVIPFIRNNWPKDRGPRTLTKERHKLVYIGPPFETRGIDLVAKYARCESARELKLIVRLEREELKRRFSLYIKDFTKAEMVTGMLSREDLFRELEECNTAVLPFKVVMSECPIVVLEALELGMQVITTSECGLASFNNFPGVILNDEIGIEQAIADLESLCPTGYNRNVKSLLATIKQTSDHFLCAEFPGVLD